MNVFEAARDILLERKTIFDYLLFEPSGEDLRVATIISKLKSDSRLVYRGVSRKEYEALQRDKRVTSLGRGNTRDVEASYVSDDIQLAGRFAFRNWKDRKGGFILSLDRSKMPKLVQADPGNYYVPYIPLEAVIDVHKL